MAGKEINLKLLHYKKIQFTIYKKDDIFPYEMTLEEATNAFSVLLKAQWVYELSLDLQRDDFLHELDSETLVTTLLQVIPYTHLSLLWNFFDPSSVDLRLVHDEVQSVTLSCFSQIHRAVDQLLSTRNALKELS